MSEQQDRSAESAEQVFAAIREALVAFPDMRVGQIISNAHSGDPFYAENAALAHSIRQLVERQRKLAQRQTR